MEFSEYNRVIQTGHHEPVKRNSRLDAYRRALGVLSENGEPRGFVVTYVQPFGTIKQRWGWESARPSDWDWYEGIHIFAAMENEDDDWGSILIPDMRIWEESLATLEGGKCPGSPFDIRWIGGVEAATAWANLQWIDNLQAEGETLF